MNNQNKRTDPNSELYRAILTLRTPEELHKFFVDLCTQSELSAIEQRYEVAKMRYEGMIYNDILSRTNVSSATVSRVNRSLLNGEGMYEVVFNRLKEQDGV